VWVLLIIVPLVPMIRWHYFIVSVGKFDHDETVKYFDPGGKRGLAGKGPFVRALPLGIVTRNSMVDDEVKKSLTEYQSTLQVCYGGCRCRSERGCCSASRSGRVGRCIITDEFGEAAR